MTEPTPGGRQFGCLFLLAVMAFTACGLALAIKGLAP